MKKQSSKSRSARKKKKGGPLVFLFIALALLISALVLLRFSGIGAAPGSDSFKQAVGSTQLMQNARLVKQDLKDIVSQMKDNDIGSMEYSSRKLDADVAVLKDYLSTPIWTIAEVVPVVGQDVKTAKALVEISEIFSGDLLKSWVALQKQIPYTELKTEDGFDGEAVSLYLDYLDRNLPTVKAMVDRLDKLNLRLVDEDGRITSYIKLAKPLLAVADEHFDDMLRPGVDFLLSHPYQEIKTDEGINFELLTQYYDFLSQNLPVAKSTVEEFNTVDLSLVDKDGKLRSYLSLAKPLLDIVDRYDEPLLTPAFTLLGEHPLSGLKDDDGIHFDEIGVWSDFLLDKSFAAENLVEDLRTLDFGVIGKAEKADAYLTTAEQLLEIGVPANKELLRPALTMLEEHPISSIKTDKGYNVRVILAYLDYAEKNYPLVDSLAEQLKALDLEPSGLGEKLEKLVDKVIELRDLFTQYKDLIPAVRVVLGDGETDRVYFFPAQNSAEVRASGGFPGNAATIEIHDGLLTIGSFSSGYGYLPSNTPNRAKITQQELRIFTARMYAPRDVDFCIDFERVASIWAMSVYDERKIEVDGVITATPIIIQKLLTAFDEPIVLSNGMTLDGTTATRVLQRDIYFEYKRAGMDIYGTGIDMTDVLFGETVDKTMDLISENMDPGHILDYINILLESIDERLLLLWMVDPEEEEILREVGWSGSLNSDPEDPKLGIFFSSEQSSKMGYFFDMIPEIGDSVLNDDGSRTYDVTLTLGNVISREEQKIGGTWILGRNYIGAVQGDLTLTAPAGGVITDIQMNIARGMRNEVYHGLDTHYAQWLLIQRGEKIVIHFKVTTAPGVDAPLGIMATPTMTKYRS